MQSARPTHEACLPRSAVFLAIFVNKMKPGWGDKVGEKKKKGSILVKSDTTGEKCRKDTLVTSTTNQNRIFFPKL